jgi:hypothetical protein
LDIDLDLDLKMHSADERLIVNTFLEIISDEILFGGGYVQR